MNKFVSVIIPVYKDWNRLSLCLNALAVQTYHKYDFEIIVVNNCPNDNIPDVCFTPKNCTVISEHKPGSYAARNAGLRIAKGEIIAFTDSDCIPHTDWISNGFKALQSNADYSRIAGRVQLYYASDKLNPAELYETVYAFNQDIYVKRDGTGVTANLFTYKQLFDKVGLFNEKLLSGGDYEWSVRAQKAGYKIKYCDDAVVSHPARNDLKELITKAKRVGGGQAGFAVQKSNLIKTYFKYLIDLRPPVKSFVLIADKGKGLHLGQKMIVAYLRYYLSVITATEKLKVNLGKVAQRS